MFAWRAFPSRGDTSTGPAERIRSAGPGSTPAPGAYLTIPTLSRVGIHAAFTTRLGGVSDDPYRSLNLSYVSGDDPDLVRVNRARVLDALGARIESWTTGRQVHGSAVVRVTARERGSGADAPGSTIPDTDALWTDEPGTALAVLTADCVPLLLADPARRRIGVVHAGWRGLVAGVVERAVDAMGEPGTLDATIGPAIGPCCYEVGEEVASAAAEALGDEAVREGPRERPHLDLWRGALDALRRAGVHAVRIAGLCTRCEPHRFFSHRAGDAGRQGLVVSLEA